MNLRMSSSRWHPFYLSLNALNDLQVRLILHLLYFINWNWLPFLWSFVYRRMNKVISFKTVYISKQQLINWLLCEINWKICQNKSLSSFLPEALLAYRYCLCLRLCVCVCLSVCQLLLVRAITRHPFKLGSPNLNQKMQNILLKVPIVLGAD